jgi:ferrous iron transport protein B
LAVKLFERDNKITDFIANPPDVEAIITQAEKQNDDDSESIIINNRYEFIGDVVERAHIIRKTNARTTSDKIDGVVTNRILALPIFALVMFLVYFISVTTVGTFATDWANDGVFGDGWFLGQANPAYEEVFEEYDAAQLDIEAFTAAAEAAELDPESETFLEDAEAAGIVGTYDNYDDETGENESVTVDAEAFVAASEIEEPNPADYGIWVPGIPVLFESALAAMNVAPEVQSLVLDGIVAGVGAVLGFVPQMLVLFLLLALLEGCGYMSRIAFILDRVFRRFGLSGKSFIPILIGTGCGVPGVMASRTIENQNDRRMTIMTTTFIPCSAKLPIIALFAGAIFGGAWWVAPSAYFMGIAAILCSGIILKKTRFFAGDTAPFLMELPEYHRPTVGSVLRSMWERAWSFIKKAGTLILLATIVVWFLSSFGFTDGAFGMVEEQSSSVLAIIGGALAWIFAPLGFGSWEATSATLTGLLAKENLVGTFGILYAGDAGWYANLQAAFIPLAGFSIMTFNLLCAPCFAAMGAIKREMNNPKWFFAAIAYQCGLAWIVALWVYQIGGLISGVVAFNFFSVLAILLLLGFLFMLFKPVKKKELVPSQITPQVQDGAA